VTEEVRGVESKSGRAATLEALLERYVERYVVSGERLPSEALCPQHPELREPLEALIARHARIDALLGGPAATCFSPPFEPEATGEGKALPSIPGFRTVERLGCGGSGEVWKLEDLTLGRYVAAKLLRRDSPLAATVNDFLREARTLALFEDPRFVRLLEYRAGDPPVLLMELVDGYGLCELGPSLEYSQRARILAEVAEALDHAHALGLQHRDLKPGHVLVDGRLRPRILDLGLSRGEPDRGHGIGTLAYMAPEQLDPALPIDARTDVYALGVILYELLCGRRPYEAPDDAALIAAIRSGRPQLPIEIEPSVPEPLQAVAMRAMSRDPAERYASARDMALDLRRYAEGRPVLARPAAYRDALARRLRPHLEQIAEWVRLRLVYPHEAERLRAAYRPLEAREDDWIVGSRVLSFSQIALYLGAFLLAAGSVLYLTMYLRDAVRGLLQPALTLLGPFVLLSGAAHVLYRRERRAAAVAFALGASALLPLALVILLREAGWLMRTAGGTWELFTKVTNLQLQAALGVALVWLVLLAARTRTVALSSGAALAWLALHLALLGSAGLRPWLEEGRWDKVAFGLVPLLVAAAAAGFVSDRRGWPWFAEPLYLGSAALFVAVLELLALDGRALAHLGVTLAPLSGTEVSDPRLLDTVVVMAVNGALFYLAGVAAERQGTPLMRTPARLLYALAPFALLEPLAYLVDTAEYPRRFDWLYLGLALTIACLAERRQRRAFYYAGLLNTGIALAYITDHHDWYARPAWALSVLAGGVAALALGLALDLRRRRGPA
jgi:serine/threonine-protein kinase